MLDLYTSAITADSAGAATLTSRGSSRATDRANITQEEELRIEELCELERFYRRESTRIMNSISAVRTWFNATAPVSRILTPSEFPDKDSARNFHRNPLGNHGHLQAFHRTS